MKAHTDRPRVGVEHVGQLAGLPPAHVTQHDQLTVRFGQLREDDEDGA